MISVLTLTYQRDILLEEAVESFLCQDFSGESEMLIVNDSLNVKYKFEHPKVRIFNLDERFASIGEKLNFGFSKCKFDHIYRLDDDDLLAPWALRNTWEDIVLHPGYEIYRSNGHYYFEHNQYIGIANNVNNGNVYTREYLSRIEIPERSFGEDSEITFRFNAKIYESPREQKTMIYRWGMNTFHISGMGNISSSEINKWTDRIVQAEGEKGNRSAKDGEKVLRPHFRENYYQKILMKS